MEFSQKISAVALDTLHTKRSRKITTLPITRDIVKLQKYINEKMAELIENFEAENCFKELAVVTLSHLISFNKRRSGEMSRMLLSDFLCRPDAQSNSDIAQMLTETKRRLTERLCLVQVRGKRGRTVPVIVTPNAFKAIELLVNTEHRTSAGINPDNKYVFALIKNSTNNIRGWDALNSTVNKAELEKPETIKGTLLRQYIATVSQILNMNENEMDWLATHLGHDIRVHRNFYRLRHEHLELAKVAKLLYAVDSGDVHKYAGKTLDDLDVDEMDMPFDQNVDANIDINMDDEDQHDTTLHDDNDIELDETMQARDPHVKVLSQTPVGVPSNRPNTGSKVKSVKLKGAGKKCTHITWTRAEKSCLEKLFHSSITKLKLAGVGKRKCEEAIKASGGILACRTWIQVKSQVKVLIEKQRKI